MEKNRKHKLSYKRQFMRKIGVLILCFFVIFNTFTAPINSYADELNKTQDDVYDEEDNSDVYSEEAADSNTGESGEGDIADIGESGECDIADTGESGEDDIADTGGEEDYQDSDDEEELFVEDESEEQDERIVNGSAISSALFTANTASWYSWRHNWRNVSYANTGRKTDVSSQFLQHCISNLANKSQACNDYVMNVLKSNGEMASSEYLTASGGTFESWLQSHNYYSVYGGYRQLVTGSTGSKTYTSIAESTIKSIQNGDILIWAYENSDGSFSTKHISIGVVYTSDLASYINSGSESIVPNEVCVFQSNGGSISGTSSVVGLESVAYYLSGANSTASYGTALKIYRRNTMTGSVNVSKETVTGNNKSDVVFGLYKVSYSGKSYMDSTQYLNTDKLDLSSLSDTNISAEGGMLTKVATFTTDSSGKGVAKLTSGIAKIHSSSSRGGTWYYINVSDDGYTISGLPIGDYIIIEEPDSIDKDCWNRGGTYEGLELGTNTVNTSWEVSQGQGSLIGINGVYHKVHTTDTAHESVNKLCDFGFGQGAQYYASFTVENQSSTYNNVILVSATNVDTFSALKLMKTSSDTALVKGNSCYGLKGATYAVYKSKDSAEKATAANYKSLNGYVGALVTDESGNTNVLSSLNKMTYYVKEVIAPKGYALTENVYTANLADSTKLTDNVYILKAADTPQSNPLDVVLVKKDSLTNKPLEGAEFTIKFYDSKYEDGKDPAAEGVEAARTWIVKTDKEGKVRFDAEHKVSGDDWYRNASTGGVVFPLGTVTIQETKAPEGYQINEQIYVYNINASGSGQNLSVYNAPEIKDSPVPEISTSAYDSKSGNRNSQTSEKTVIYDDVLMTNLIAGRTYTIKGVLMDRDTGDKLMADGKEVTAEKTFEATESTMTVTMTYEFNSLELKGKETVVFEDLYEDGKKIAVHNDLTDEHQTIQIEETKVAFDKVDSSTGESIAGAKLSLHDSEDNVLESWVSNGEKHIIRNLTPGTYTLVEDVAPSGYRTAENVTFELDYSFEEISVTMEDDVITGGVHITKVDYVDSARRLQGVTFMLFKKYDSIIDTALDREYMYAENITEEIKQNRLDESDLYIGTFVTDENGEIFVENLSYGSYYMVETETLDTYELLDTQIEFDIDETHTENEITVQNTAREGWIVYGSESINIVDKAVSNQSTPVKTGDETAVLWIMVLMVTAFGMIIVLVRRRKKTSELLVISAMLILAGAGIGVGGGNCISVKAQETETVSVGRSVDTGYCDTEPDHEEYIMDTYTDESTGKKYDVKLTFVKSECIESGYNVPVELTGSICDYEAEYIIYNGKRYDNPGDNLSSIEGLIIDFAENSGYPSGSYSDFRYSYSGQAYVGEDGLMYRDFKVEFNTYAKRYRFYYRGSVSIPAHNTDSTSNVNTDENPAENSTANSAVDSTANQSTESAEDADLSVTTESEQALDNRIDAEADEEIEEENTGSTEANTQNEEGDEENDKVQSSVNGSGSDDGNGGTGGGGKTDSLKQDNDNIVNKILCAVLAVIALGAGITYMFVRRREVTE